MFSQGSGSAGGIFGGASIPGAHTHLEVDITDLDKFSQAAADARFAPISHTHLEADITDLRDYLLKTGGTMTGNLTLFKATPVLILDATGVTNSLVGYSVAGVSRFITGLDNLAGSYKVNTGGLIDTRSDFVMDSTGKVTFGVTPEVGGTAVSLVGHTHLEADITDLQNYSLVGHTHIFANLTDSIADGQVPVGSVTQHEAALAIAFSQITGTVDADLLDGLDSTAFALASHTHLEADITDLKDYLELAGGTMTGDLFLTKTTPGLRMNALGTSNSFIAWQDDGSSKFIMGWKNFETSFKLNIGSSLAARSDFVMDAAGLVTFGATPEVSGTAVSLVGHTHLEADITDLGPYVLAAGGTFTAEIIFTSSEALRAKSIAPEILLEETDGPLDEKIWGYRANGGNLTLRTINDAFTAASNWMLVSRTGITVDQVTFFASVEVGKFGANGTTPITKPTITGSRGGNAALASLLTALANYGLITDSTT